MSQGPARDDAFRGALGGRVRELRPRERDMLMHAALIGRRFDVGLLALVLGRSPTTVLRGLRRACRLQILCEGDGNDIDGEGTVFEFRHALVRDAVYRELVAHRLRPFHRKIARALERLAASHDAFGSERAYHWWAAGDAARAREYNEHAGDGALAVHAKEGARAYYERALELLRSDAPERIRLEGKLNTLDAPESIHDRSGTRVGPA